ncbi:PREDICTED: uncharacterized protein LOC109482333 [Branchiostoma belcheri]|uniref:Uncharacterized protein LOC109482333 n=1 Tax=Branchiostoma belcheri TaxID=7741 RepID=A0A6P4ZUL0_BRABE|nr:PREDICTED: uncharacterized protein LOC109482333 [Branchiostoma belcheri]
MADTTAGGGKHVFQGNRDANGVKTNTIDPPIVTRFIRLMAVTWRFWGIAFRLELLGNFDFKVIHNADDAKLISDPVFSEFYNLWVRGDIAIFHRIRSKDTDGNESSPRPDETPSTDRIYNNAIMFTANDDSSNNGNVSIGQSHGTTYANATFDQSEETMSNGPYPYATIGDVITGQSEETDDTIYTYVQDESYSPRPTMKPPLCMILLLLLQVRFMMLVTATDCRSALGVESGVITDDQISASSSWSSQYQPREARLNNLNAWSPNSDSTSEWLQVDMLERTSITGIQTQGHRYFVTSHFVTSHYVTSYKLIYSNDGINWNIFQENGSDKVFQGNRDANGVKTNTIDPPIVTRFIRLMAVRWQVAIAFRLELLGCELEYCRSALGVETGVITDDQFSASSSFSSQYQPREARLNSLNAWSPSSDSTSDWLQVDMLERTSITGIQTQGHRYFGRSYYVTSYKLIYSNDGINWNIFQENGSDKIFEGNSNGDGVKTNYIDPPIVTRFIRLMPVTWERVIAFRLELLGCELEYCRSALGVESGAIRNNQFSASSSVSDSWQPWEARLNSGRAWMPSSFSTSEWLQVDLLKRMSITGIQTQGQASFRFLHLVTSYKLLYSDDGTDLNWNTFQENGSDKIFEGNIDIMDPDIVKTNYIDPPIVTRFIRLMPVTWGRWWIALRLELLGCELESNTTSAAPPTTETLPTTYLLSSTKKTTTSAAPQRSTSTSISSGPEVTSPSSTNTSDGSTDKPAGTTSGKEIVNP